VFLQSIGFYDTLIIFVYNNNNNNNLSFQYSVTCLRCGGNVTSVLS